jgi:hypothetical protein
MSPTRAHPQLAHAVVLLDHERVAAEPLCGRDRQRAEQLGVIQITGIHWM